MTTHNDLEPRTAPRLARALPLVLGLPALALAGCTAPAASAGGHKGGGEANLHLPDLHIATFFGGAINGWALLLIGLLICVFGLGFGLWTYRELKSMPVHASMLEMSELIYETCKAYLVQQGKFLMRLWGAIAVVIVLYFAISGSAPLQIGVILLFSLIGMAGSYAIAWYGIRVNTFANSRTAFAALRGRPYDCHNIPMRSGMSVGMMLISVELFFMLGILLFVPGQMAGSCFIGFAVGESLGASALRIAGGIFTKIADVGSDLMKIVFKIKEDDARNPGVIADCTGDNAGDSVGPSADGFETYGVTGVALITFIMLAVKDPTMQATLLVWIFAIRSIMVLASAGSYFFNAARTKARYGTADAMDFEAPLTSLVWITSIVSIVLSGLVSWALIPNLGGDPTNWVKLWLIISCGTLAGALIPELVKVFTSVKSKHVQEVVKSAREGGASLDILSGLVAGNFSGYWLGMAIIALMGVAYGISTIGLDSLMLAPAVFAFGLVAFGFLGMGPVTIAVDSYGPVTDNAQSVYELSTIETIEGADAEIKAKYGFDVQWDKAKRLLEENDGAGNTFKATAKPVLIGTAVVGATTMIFSIIVGLTVVDGKFVPEQVANLSLLHAPFLLGLVTGGAIIYWFTGASIQAVTTGSFRAVQFIKDNIKLDENATKASVEDSKKVVEICTIYAQKGMLNIFLGIFFATLAFAFIEPFFFIGYLISIALFGLYQAIFMANAGGAWDNAKKIVEVDLGAKGTELHDASIVGDTVGDPYKDTSSVALNPVIKFTTLFGLLAVDLGLSMRAGGYGVLVIVLAVVFFLASVYFVWASFFKMLIDQPMATSDDFATPVEIPASTGPTASAVRAEAGIPSP
ncbi:sodium-translocating pyrophosphatase [Propioniciclava tarda]|uniref:K(+)-insensitive pyrophosphate-energized proton pump n=1 Tax=Propioniciclava tarda TaxID=433330 RepID=A0A4V6MV52_PROTD|nr:sodium-translocating pyrophosphatase [Propioniciclava tarda]TBT95281.1 sodium-translocating pyrophosphatase [Propioniciclava tarda]SMO60200.1 K(+)-stimulated pyrophosphate-energized sodium pump [Propioniciclava tarda]